MPAVQREALDSPWDQGANEVVTYWADFAEWGADASTPVTGTPAITVWEVNENDQDTTNVTSTILVVGSVSVAEDTQVYFRLDNMTAGTKYRLVIQVVIDTDTLELYAFIEATP